MSSDESHLKTVNFRGANLEVNHSASNDRHGKRTELWKEIVGLDPEQLSGKDLSTISKNLREIIILYTTDDAVTHDYLSQFDIWRNDTDGLFDFAIKVTPSIVVKRTRADQFGKRF